MMWLLRTAQQHRLPFREARFRLRSGPPTASGRDPRRHPTGVDTSRKEHLVLLVAVDERIDTVIQVQVNRGVEHHAGGHDDLFLARLRHPLARHQHHVSGAVDPAGTIEGGHRVPEAAGGAMLSGAFMASQPHGDQNDGPQHQDGEVEEAVWHGPKPMPTRGFRGWRDTACCCKTGGKIALTRIP